MSSSGALRLHPVDAAIAVDRDRAEAAVAELLEAFGRDVGGEHLADTPRRVVDGLLELITPREFTATTFPNDDAYDELVLVRDIPFTSLCEHHLLPFRGVAHVGYIPGPRLVGLSKLARIVEWYAHDLQVQERLTVQIADHLERHLEPAGVGVVLRAEHLCMSVRGVQAVGSTTETHVFRGAVAADDRLRRRFEASGP
ncbi:GTP cyclohydrolase I [Microbacterium immunditiarum]|uniref:GTP cyclohydrolase 1 n=1 Tax=Microbacterium immunditiarum TaxID=337480 RepID=A0A7Y9GN44_9MICO|nr:GTP cyclohydrolase I [Microbacterium immunditiarum]NYE19579.1 GTP cyclohydrolase I [Microbacterium immunditiarum]